MKCKVGLCQGRLDGRDFCKTHLALWVYAPEHVQFINTSCSLSNSDEIRRRKYLFMIRFANRIDAEERKAHERTLRSNPLKA